MHAQGVIELDPGGHSSFGLSKAAKAVLPDALLFEGTEKSLHDTIAFGALVVGFGQVQAQAQAVDLFDKRTGPELAAIVGPQVQTGNGHPGLPIAMNDRCFEGLLRFLRPRKANR